MKKLFTFTAFLILLGTGCNLKPGVPEDFSSKEECEKFTGRGCSYAMCDYVPEGQTFEQACGINFKEGWVPASK